MRSTAGRATALIGGYLRGARRLSRHSP